MVVYTARSPMSMLTVVWALLWTMHYLWTAFHSCMEHVQQEARLQKMQRSIQRSKEKLKRLSRTLKTMEQKIEDLTDIHKMQYEHFTQLIEHVRADILDRT